MKDRILNEMVQNTANLMEAHAQSLDFIAQQFNNKGDHEKAAHIRRDLPRIAAAIALIREYGGCWTA